MALLTTLLGHLPGCSTATRVEWHHAPTQELTRTHAFSDPSLAPFRHGGVLVIPSVKGMTDPSKLGIKLWLVSEVPRTLTVHALTATGLGSQAEVTRSVTLDETLTVDQPPASGAGLRAYSDGLVLDREDLLSLSQDGGLQLTVAVRAPDESQDTDLSYTITRQDTSHLVMPGW